MPPGPLRRAAAPALRRGLRSIPDRRYEALLADLEALSWSVPSYTPGDEFAGEAQINRLQKIRYLAAAEARRQAVRGQLDEIPLFQGAGADHDVVDLMIRQDLPRRRRCCRHQVQHRKIATVV